MSESLVFTALPRSVDSRAGQLRLAVHIAPRVQPPTFFTTLGQLDNTSFLDWPAVVSGIGWKVQFGTGAIVDATPDYSALNSRLWQALFPSSLAVRAFELPDLTGKIKSFPVQHVANPVIDRYVSTVRTSPVVNPDPTAVQQAYIPMSFRQVKTGASQLQYHFDKMESRRTKGATHRSIEPKATVLQQNLLQAVTFHNREIEARLSGANPASQPAAANGSGQGNTVTPPENEFHLLVAYLHDRPTLLRPLGLVVDLVVTLPRGFQYPTDGATTIRALPQWSRAGESPPPPRTWANLTTKVFEAKSRTSTIANGLAVLSDPSFKIYDFDVDGAALQTIDFANAVADEKFGGRLGMDREPDGTADVRPPGFRTNGMALTKLGRAVEVDGRLSGLQALNGKLLDGSLELYAEDVLRGYRVDVMDLDGDKTWRSLMRRVGTYKIRAADTEIPVDDEGVLSLSVTQDDKASDDVRVTEVMAQWDGWSLTVPRPHAALSKDNTPVLTRTLAERDGAAAGTPEHVRQYPIEDRLAPPVGSLPRLRFGHRYRFRMRTVDLAGDSAVRYTANSGLHASSPVRYSRHDPVSPPQLLFRAPPTEGESAEVLVIRSDFDTPAANTVPCLRIAVPPKVAQQIVEHAGRLDVPGGSLDAAGYADIAARDKATMATLPQRRPQTIDPSVGQDTMFFTRSNIAVPYFPDPDLRAARFRGLPGGEVAPVPFYPAGAAFPNAQTFEIRLVEGNQAPVVQAPTRETPFYRLTLALPKGGTKRVEMAAALTTEGSSSHGIFELMQQAGVPTAEIDSMRTQAIEGLLWATSPVRAIRLVHAVRRPLTAPGFGSPVLMQVSGRSATRLYDENYSIHRGSTGSLALTCTWTEQVDRGPGTPAPTTALRSFTLNPAIDKAGVLTQRTLIDHTFDLGDTRHRRLSVGSVATSRFAEYFRQRLTLTLPADAAPVQLPAGVNRGSVVVQLAGAEKIFEEGRHYVVDYAASTIRRTMMRDGQDVEPDAIPSTSAIEVSLLAGIHTRGSGLRPTMLTMRSTARPAPPKFAYAVPAFEWDSSQSGTVRTSVRSGGRLRIYLERPWFSSGEGERLGIVFWRRPAGYGGPRPAALDKLVSTRATDPVYGSPVGATEFSATSFPGAIIENGILEEVTSNGEVSVATYPVAFDAAKDLWYADVRFAQERYSPMVRLALVRYQPEAFLSTLHISRVRLTEFLIVPPTRTVDVDHADGASSCTITVSGQGMNAIKSVDTPARVTAAMQSKDDDVPDPDLGWTTLRGKGGGLNLPWSFPLTPSVLSDGRVVWRGENLTVPSGTERILIEEYEHMRTDHKTDAETGTEASRVVFTDHIRVRGPGIRG